MRFVCACLCRQAQTNVNVNALRRVRIRRRTMFRCRCSALSPLLLLLLPPPSLLSFLSKTKILTHCYYYNRRADRLARMQCERSNAQTHTNTNTTDSTQMKMTKTREKKMKKIGFCRRRKIQWDGLCYMPSCSGTTSTTVCNAFAEDDDN